MSSGKILSIYGKVWNPSLPKIFVRWMISMRFTLENARTQNRKDRKKAYLVLY